MFQTLNNTPFESELVVFPDHNGRDTAIAVVKATFSIEKDCITVSEIQAPIIMTDEYWGDPRNTSLKYASEVSLPKPHTDIVMIGHAYSNGRTKSHVRLRVGDYEKTVTVYGDRTWKGLISVSDKSDANPFYKIPLLYERAFGGSDEHKSDPNRRETCAENPVGTGFTMSSGKNRLKGMRAPNIEPVNKGISTLWSADRPDGFGYIAPHWKPRADLCGTFDDAWKQERMPYMPADFNPRFYNAAHPDLITGNYLKGNESVLMENACPEKIVNFRLPGLSMSITFNIGGHKTIVLPSLDTLILEPDQQRFMLIYRAGLSCDKKRMEVFSAEINLTSQNHRISRDNRKVSFSQ